MARLALMALLSTLALQDQQRPIAIVNVTVVPMDRERVVAAQTVIVQDGRIKAIGQSQSIRVPIGAVQIDGTGKFLMPGLADMHVHFVREALKQEPQRANPNSTVRQPGIPASASDDHERENRAYALMFVANGVTTVRNLWGSETIDAFAHEIDYGDVIGPHVYSAGPITDGDPPIWQGSRIVETAAQAENAVRSDKQRGYVAIKVYSALSNEAYHTIVGAARRQGMPVVGHVPISVGLMGAVEARQDSIEHLDSFLAVLQPDGAAGAPKSLSERIQEADLKKLPAVVQAIKDSGVWICPTVVVNDLPRTDSTWLEEASFVPPNVFERYPKDVPESWNRSEDHLSSSRLEYRDCRGSAPWRSASPAWYGYCQAGDASRLFAAR